jgi:hypothetical protein
MKAIPHIVWLFGVIIALMFNAMTYANKQTEKAGTIIQFVGLFLFIVGLGWIAFRRWIKGNRKSN